MVGSREMEMAAVGVECLSEYRGVVTVQVEKGWEVVAVEVRALEMAAALAEVGTGQDVVEGDLAVVTVAATVAVMATEMVVAEATACRAGGHHRALNRPQKEDSCPCR